MYLLPKSCKSMATAANSPPPKDWHKPQANPATARHPPQCRFMNAAWRSSASVALGISPAWIWNTCQRSL